MQRMRVPAAARTASAARAAAKPPLRRRVRDHADNLAAQRRRKPTQVLERDAEDRARRLLHGQSGEHGKDGERGEVGEHGAHARSAGGRLAQPMLGPSAGGRPLDAGMRDLAGSALGDAARRVRVHDDEQSQRLVSAMRARAMADGADIWLGPGETEHDRELMAHELAHLAQAEPGPHLRPATWLERRAWLSFFDHYLPRKFLDNYMDDTGAPIVLTPQEMIDVNPIVNIRRSPGFASELAALQARVKAAAGPPAPAAKSIDVTGPGQALTNGTLGNFTIRYKGVLTVSPDGNWVFSGFMEFHDIWDFDPKPFGSSGRSTAGELKTRVAAACLPGKAFEISSFPSLYVQAGTDPRATWAGGTPQFVGDRAERAGADVEVSGVGGEVVGSPALGPIVGAPAGAEVGAQSAKDLNR